MPNDTRALQRALDHHVAGRFDEAERCYRDALDAAREPEALHGLGLIALERGDLATALDLLEEAVERSPRNPRFLSNLAAAALRARLPEHAAECAASALALDAGYADAYANQGHALARLGRAAAAEQSFRKALELDPSAHNRLNLALARLYQADYANALPLYEARLELRQRSGDSAQMLQKLSAIPRWRGEALSGRRLLVWTEQGLGDSLMMARFLPLLRELGAARVALCCEEPLVRLMRALSIDEVFSDVDAEDWPRRFDLHCPMMSLPLAFGARLETVPRPQRYLEPPPEVLDAWKARTAALPRPLVGLAWQSGALSDLHAYRDVSLGELAPLLEVADVTFVSLQKTRGSTDLPRTRRPFVDWMSDCRDMADTAALIDTLDLTISVDTSVAHLAGALGRRVWLLNRRGGDWRFSPAHESAPWYPTMRIFRQQGSSWRPVIDELALALGKDFAPHHGGLVGRLAALFGQK